jgi:hypothetical protein
MSANGLPDLDLMPPAFSEGLYDWSRGDGIPDGPTYGEAGNARLAVGDPDFGTCLELRKIEPVQKLRYMGEMPFRRGSFIEVSAGLKALRGPLGLVQVAAWPGGQGGHGVPGLPTRGRLVELDVRDRVYRVAAVIGPEALPGVDMVWDERVLYAHVGLDLLGPANAVVRIENLAVRDVTARITSRPRTMPGFVPGDVPVGSATQ